MTDLLHVYFSSSIQCICIMSGALDFFLTVLICNCCALNGHFMFILGARGGFCLE